MLHDALTTQPQGEKLCRGSPLVRTASVYSVQSRAELCTSTDLHQPCYNTFTGEETEQQGASGDLSRSQRGRQEASILT